MKTNDIKKGMRVQLHNGWYGTMMDNMKGNTRMVEVEGNFTEIGSVYAHDIVYVWPDPDKMPWRVEYTPAQEKLRERVKSMGF